MESKKETVTLQIEGSPVTCVKQVLIDNSFYFSAMFQGNFIESTQNIVKIKGVELNAFNIILILLSDPSYIVDNKDLLKVLQTACMLQFNTIQKLCEVRVLEILNPFNCLKTWKVTEQLDIAPLFLKAKCMALEEFTQIWDSESIFDLNLNDICVYLGNSGLRVKNEFLVFQTAMKWWYENEKRYSTSMKVTTLFLRLLNCIDFNTLKENEIREMKTYPDVKDNSEIISILNCVLDLRTGSTTDSESVISKEHRKFAVHFCNSRSRRLLEIPCLLFESQMCNVFCANQNLSKVSELEDYDCNCSLMTSMYDKASNEFRKLCTIDGDKCKDLVGFRIQAYKEFVFFYGGEFLMGAGNWNYNLWVYDTFRDRWERKIKLPHERRHFETCIVDSCIYIIGGTGKFRIVQENILWYNFKSDKWSSVFPLPCAGRKLKCCSFKEQLFVLDLERKCGYFFNKETLRKVNVVISSIPNPLNYDFTIFSYKDYFYIKGKYLLKFKLEEENLVLESSKELNEIAYEDIKSVLCQNTVYTLYLCFNESCRLTYTFESFNLDTNVIEYIFRYKLLRSCFVIEGRPYCLPQYPRLFAFHHYSIVKENSLVNDCLPE